MAGHKPALLVRLAILGGMWLAAWIEHNPLVWLIARLGLSPSPLERLFGIRGLFSGMTESTHQLARLNLVGSLQANVLTIPLLGLVMIAVLRWQAPKLVSGMHEALFFGSVILGTIVNNLAPVWLAHLS